MRHCNPLRILKPLRAAVAGACGKAGKQSDFQMIEAKDSLRESG